MGSKKGAKLQKKWATTCYKERKRGRRIGMNPSLYNCNAYYANGNVHSLTKEEVAVYENSLTPTEESFIIT